MNDNGEAYVGHMEKSGNCSSYNLKNLINEPARFKNMENPGCIDLVLTNKFSSFQQSSVMETDLSDFHRLTITIMNTNIQK